MDVLPVAITFDFLTSVNFWTSVGVLAATYALVALGLQLNVGFTGVVNFGAAGFMAVGAYTMAILTIDTEISFWLSLPISILVTMAFGLIVGLPSLRLRTDYLAIATIAFAEIIRLIAQNARELTGGNQGLFCSDDQSACFDDTWLDLSDTIEGWLVDLGWSDPEILFPLLLVGWALVLVVTVGLLFVQRSPWGRVLRAVREDEDAARALGKNAVAYKLQSLVISAAIAAIAGWILALNLATTPPDRLRAPGDLLRLRGARAGRACQLLGGAGRLGDLLDAARGNPLHRRVSRRVRPGCAALRDRRPGADPADGLPATGDVRQARGDGAR